MVTLKKKCCCTENCTCNCATSLKFKYTIWPITSTDPDGCPLCEDYKAISNEPYSSDADGSMYGCIVWDSGCTWKVESPTGVGIPLSNFGPYNCGDSTTPNPSISLSLGVEPDCFNYFTINFPAGTVVYVLETTFNCAGSNTFTLQSGDPGIIGNCQLPTTITVEPTDYCGPCDNCADNPISMRFTLTSTGGGGDCSDYDGDYCLCPFYASCGTWAGYNTNGMYAEIWYEGPYSTDGRSLTPTQPIFFSTGYYVLRINGLGEYSVDAAYFDCSGDTIFTLTNNNGVSCTSPTTITVSVSPDDCPDACTKPPPPPESCNCTPKSDYSPRITVSGLTDGTCSDCSCVPMLDLCFEPYGTDDTDCLWIANISLPASVPIDCTTTATYAILNMEVAGQTLTFYNVSDVPIVAFSSLLAGCDSAGITLAYSGSIPSETCNWSGAVATLDMHGASCESCLCDAQAWNVSIDYDGDTHTFCVAGCTGTSDTSDIFGGGGDSLYIVIDLGELPAVYARILVYYLPSGGVVGINGDLIGVYNYLSDMTSFSCSSSNTLHLSAGNAGECGSDVNEVRTADLASTASMSPVTCGGTLTYTTPGTYYLCTQVGVTYSIQCWGAGASGRGGTAGNRNGGGGGGAYAIKSWVSDGSTLVIVVPSGGSASTTDGNNGADATVDGATTLCKAAGGKGAATSAGGAGGATADCIGDTKYKGGDGATGEPEGIGGGGGSSAGTGSNGNNGTGGDFGGAGGTAVTGGGAGGAGGNAAGGTAGSAPGGGGGGADNDTGGSSGAGANGKVIISC